jgi:hypothetical protein
LIYNYVGGGSTYAASQFILSANSWDQTVTVEGHAVSNGPGRVCFLAISQSSPLCGYLFKYSAVNGEHKGQILRIDNGVANDIGTYATGATNTSALTGAHSFKVTFRSPVAGSKVGDFAIYIDGHQVATGTDKTYSANGSIGYGAEVNPASILGIKIQGHQETVAASQASGVPNAPLLHTLSTTKGVVVAAPTKAPVIHPTATKVTHPKAR